MKKLLISIIALFACFGSVNLKAQEFFDTDIARKFFSLGARVGFNTSNRSFPTGDFVNHTFTNWGIGFNAGVVANLNLREYISLQPGFFYSTRSADLINIAEYTALPIYGGGQRTYYEKNHLLGYYFNIPIMGIMKFNLAENIKWNVEFGPYLEFALKQKGFDNVILLYRPNKNFAHYSAKQNSFDFGFKLGSGLTFYKKYYVGFHYLAGVCHAWHDPAGGKNKSWQFSVGYEFY